MKFDECVENDQMPWYNWIAGKYECYGVTEQGPCEEGQIFVLDKNPKSYVSSTCMELSCNGTLGKISMMDSGDCETVGDPKPCEKGEKVIINNFGEGKATNIINTKR